jgi:hypothetical protein
MNKTIHPIEPEELMAYLDGELSNDKAAVAAAHLSECGECREVVTELRGVSQALKAWDVGSADSTVSSAISAALEEGTRNQGKAPIPSQARIEVFRHRWHPVAWIGALAAIALLAFVASPTLRHAKVARVVEDTRSSEQSGDRDRLDKYVPSPPAARSAPESEVVGGLPMRQSAESMVPPQGGGGGAGDSSRIARRETNVPTPTGPMIIRTADLSLITKEFDKARANVEAILKRHRGYVGELKVGGAAGSGRTLNATLRVPADQLDASLTELKTLGRVESESQSGQDITSQYVDLQARLGNARNTEQRLTDLLRQRTGKLSDVLEVEQEVARVRGEIEQMEAERKTMSNQVSFATLNATITEDYKAQLQVVPPSTSTRLSNAAVEGYKSMVDGIVSLMLFLLEDGPTLLLWGAILFFPARLVWKRVRRGFAH